MLRTAVFDETLYALFNLVADRPECFEQSIFRKCVRRVGNLPVLVPNARKKLRTIPPGGITERYKMVDFPAEEAADVGRNMP